jgi:hypothetical protein
VYGEIEKISVNKHPDNLKVTLELATVDFENPNDADTALADMTGPKVNTHTWKIMRATNKAFNEILLRFLGRNKDKIRLVKNLPENITENMFLHLLLQFGMVRSCHVPCITNVSYDADGNAHT